MDHDFDKEAHAQQVPWRDPIDGLNYIENTIRWDIHKARHALTVCTQTC